MGTGGVFAGSSELADAGDFFSGADADGVFVRDTGAIAGVSRDSGAEAMLSRG